MELESENQDQPQTPPPSTWDKLDAVTPPNQTTWDRLDVLGAQRSNPLDFMTKMAASKSGERAARVVRLSNKFRFPEPFVENNLEALEEQERQQQFNTEGLVNSNPKLSELISNGTPNEVSTLLSGLPNYKKLEHLYTKPLELLPLPEGVLKERSREIAKNAAAKDWATAVKLKPGDIAPYASPSSVTTFTSQKEMEDAYYSQILDAKKAQEEFIAGDKPLDWWDSVAEKYKKNPVFWLPYGGDVVGAGEMKLLYEAAQAQKAGNETPEQAWMLEDFARMEKAAQFRGTTFAGKLTESLSSLPAFAGEVATTGGLYNAAEGAIFKGGGKLLAEDFLKGAFKRALEKGFLSSVVKKGAAVLGASAIQAIPARGIHAAEEELKSAVVKGDTLELGHAAWDTFVRSYGEILGANSMQALKPIENAFVNAIIRNNSGATLTLIQDQLRKAGVGGFLGMLGQGEVAKLINAAGGVEPYHAPTGEEALVAMLTGAIPHALATGLDLTLGRQDLYKAQLHADAFLQRASILRDSDLTKELPDHSRFMSESMAGGGPNEYTLVPVKSFAEYWGDQAQEKAAALGITPEKFRALKNAGVDMTVKTAALDHVIGADEAAAKFFSREIRPGDAPDMMNVREGEEWQKRLADRHGLPTEEDAARQKIVQQIIEQARTDKIKAAISLARLDQGSEPLIADPAILGLNEEQGVRLAKVMGEAQAMAEDYINQKEIARRDKLKGDLYAKERDRVQAEVEKEVDARPEHVALARLQRHESPNGTPLPEQVPKIKLSREALQAEGYKESLLPRGVVEGGRIEGQSPESTGYGVDPETAAGMLRFQSGHDLILALIGMGGKSRQEAIKAETDARMEARYPSVFDTSRLSQEAERALHNKKNAELKHLTAKYILENKLGAKVVGDLAGVAARRLPSMGQITSEAEREIAGTPTGQLDPRKYLMAERRAMAESMTLARGAKAEELFDKKLEELRAHEMYRAAVDRLESSNKKIERLSALPENTTLNKPDVADYGQQVKAFLARIGLYAPSREEMVNRKPFQQWAQEKFDSGETRGQPIFIDPKFADETQALGHYKDLTGSDIDSLAATIDQIKYLAKEKYDVSVGARKASVKIAVDGLTGELAENYKELPLSKRAGSLGEKRGGKNALKELDALLDSPEAWFDRNGGRKIDSEWNRQYNQYVEARTKYEHLRKQIAVAVREAWDKLSPEESKAFDKKVSIPGVKIPLSLREIACIVANGGNESSYSKEIRGEAIPRERGGRDIGLTEEKIQEAATHLSEAQKDHVQRILDITNMLWREIEELHIWATGAAPKKIEAKQMIRAMGDRPGGYYPAMYDREFSKVGDMQLERDSELGKLIPQSWKSATTDAGYRESRVEEFAAPMDFDFGRLAGHMDSMIQDLAFRKWVLEFNKIASNGELKRTIGDRLGSEYENFLSDWMKRAIGKGARPSDASNSILRKGINAVRHNITIATLGLRASTVLHHLTGVDLAVAEVGATNFMKAYGDFWSAPKARLEQMAKEAPDLAEYTETFDPNIKAAFDRLEGKKGNWADFQRFCMKGIQYANITRAVPTYFAAKAKAVADLSAKGYEGAELHNLAVQYAQRTVRTTIGSGKAGDLPAIMTSDLAKTMLMFYTPGRLRYAQVKNAIFDKTHGGSAGQAIFKALWMLPAAAALHTLVSGKMPDEDKDETYLGMYATDMASYAFSPLPLGHELASAAVDIVSGKKHDSGLSSPIFKGLEQGIDAIQKTDKWWEDEAEFEDVFRSYFRTAGYWFGAPTDQLEITGGNMWDIAAGRGSDPNDAWEFLHDILWRRPKSRR